MNEMSDSELFSAYLDGELTADEQVRAERMLAVSPEARQLLEELRAVSSSLQGLPQQKLDEDLSARVLQIAERRMLAPEESNVPDTKPSAGRAAAAMTTSEDDSATSEGFPWRQISWRGMFGPRALTWSAIVVIVAIFIHYNSPAPKPNRNLAFNDAARSKSDAVDVKRSKSTSDGSWVGPADRSRKPGLDAVAGNREPSAAPVKAEESSAAAKDKAADARLERENTALFTGDHGAPMKAMRAMPRLSTKEKEIASADKVAEEKPGEVSKPEATPPSTPIPAKAAAKPGLMLAAKAPMGRGMGGGGGSMSLLDVRNGGVAGIGRSRGGESLDEIKDAPAEPARGARDESKAGFGIDKNSSPAADALAANQSPAIAPMSVGPLAAPAVVAGPGTMASRKPDGGQMDDLAAHRGSATVVRMNISSAALQAGRFNKLLAHNGVSFRADRDNRRQSSAPNQNFQAENSGLTVQGMSIPRGGTASMGGMGGLSSGQQRIAPAPAEALQGPQAFAQNSASRPEPQIANAQSTPTSQPRPTAAADMSNGALPAPAARSATQYNFSQPKISQSGDASKPSGAVAGSGPTSISYELDATPTQLAAVLKEVGQQNGDFSLVEVVLSPAAKRHEEAAKQQPGKAAGRSPLPRSQAAPARVIAEKTRVVFVLNIVDRISTPAAATPAAPATAVPTPAASTQGK